MSKSLPYTSVAPRVPERPVRVLSELGVPVRPLIGLGPRGGSRRARAGSCDAAIFMLAVVPGVGPAEQRLGRCSAVLACLARAKARVEGTEHVLERHAVRLGIAVETDHLQKNNRRTTVGKQ